MTTITGGMPSWVAVIGGILLAIAGATMIAIRPADKAAMNEADMRRYQALMPRAETLNVTQLTLAIKEAHQGDAPEIETLRDVAFNDVMGEINRMDCAIPLSVSQQFLRSLA